MKKVIVAGVVYLGNLCKNEDGTFTLNDAFEVPSGMLNVQAFAGYLKAKNLGELQTIDFGGQGNTYTISKLSKDQKLELKVCKLNMRRAKDTAMAITENEVMDSIMGK